METEKSYQSQRMCNEIPVKVGVRISGLIDVELSTGAQKTRQFSLKKMSVYRTFSVGNFQSLGQITEFSKKSTF